MRTLAAILSALFLLVVLGCGGGGGGGGASQSTIVGRVLNVATGGPTNPRSSVQVGANSTLTSASDGSFSLPAPNGTTSVQVDTLGAFGVWTFAFAPSNGVTDVGDLWVGPEQVTVEGTVLNSVDNQPVPGATVSFAGRLGTTDANGHFSLPNVAYSSATQTAFWGIAGFVRKNGFDPAEFSAQPHVAVGGVVTVDDILMTPTSDPNPPGPPYNIWGRVSPPAEAPGTIATLKENGNPVRIFNVGSDGIYRFWVPPGAYSIDFVKGNLTANVPSVVLTQPNDVIRQDVTLQ